MHWREIGRKLGACSEGAAAAALTAAAAPFKAEKESLANSMYAAE